MMNDEQRMNQEEEVLALLTEVAMKLRRLAKENPELLKQLEVDDDPAYVEWAAAYFRGEGNVQSIAKRLDGESGDEDTFWQQRAELADMISALLKRRPMDLPESD